jgi:ferrous iron transport protein A
MFNSIFALWTGPKRANPCPRDPTRHPDTLHTNSLDRVKAGHGIKVVQIVAGQMATRQLAQLGIRVGSLLTVLRTAPLGGPILVESAGSTVAIGRGLARKVNVQILK